jgi:hypothetical protein
MSRDPLRGIDFSERIKPLMQQVVLLDQKRMAEIADLKQRLAKAEARLRLLDADTNRKEL